MMKRLFFASEKLLLALWTGAAWMTGTVVAPITFQVLSAHRGLAGTLAGKLFSIISYAGIAIAVIMIISILIRHSGSLFKNFRLYLAALMGTLLSINLFVLHPMIAASRLKIAQIEHSSQQQVFALLHKTASIDYVIACIIALALLIDKLRSSK